MNILLLSVVQRVVDKFVVYISCKDIDIYLKDHKCNFEESINNGGFSFHTEKMLLIYVVILDIFQYFTRYTKDNNPVKG
ncbi:hypothetical protein P029_04575 [Anaplasma phagocytophilum str. Norway variant2]|uniref:Uncharacterized protein n=1 Tax=Anaplasma phagocytophilum str. Norway variant2 TaxID=1392507 RepID=A0A168HHA0_ANAPH|nr:hypothetical protein P029_04575 [Anaplasma phagocytophilum str. Norway variant2]